MAKKKPVPTPRRPRSSPLPGMEDRTIKPLEDIAEEYVEIRDQRMDLTQREHALKQHAMKLMKKYDKTHYKHDGVEIFIVPGEDDVKVKVKKAGDEEPAAGGAEFAAERAAAVAED